MVGLTCPECGRYDLKGKGWCAYLGREFPQAAVQAFVVCPECARREFDWQ